MAARRRKILFACTTAFTMATLYKGLFPYLERQGWDIEIAVGGRDLAEFSPADFGAPTLHRLSMEREVSPLKDLAGLFAFMRLLARRRYDVIHVSTPKASLLGSIAAFLTGNGPVVFVYRRRIYELMGGAKKWLYINIDRVIAALSRYVVPVSRGLGDQLIADRVCKREKLYLIGSGSSNGINVTRFAPDANADEAAMLRVEMGIPEDAPVLLFVGRIIGEKGVDLLPRIHARIREMIPGAHLVLVGPEDDRDPVTSETLAYLRGAPQTHWLGYRSDPRAAYSLADVFVFPSYFEGFANVLLECAAMELPAVAFDVSGVREVMADGVSGTLVPSGDADAMSDACIAILNDPELRARMAKDARARVVAEYSSEVVHAEIHRLLDMVAQAGR